jgi:hypothetical protein
LPEETHPAGTYIVAAYLAGAAGGPVMRAQYFDPSAPPLTASDATWAIGKAKEAPSGAKALLAASPPERFG